MQLGLFDACLQAMIVKALDNPRHLGEPVFVSKNYGDGSSKPNSRRRLFGLDLLEDLITRPLQLYEPIIYGMNQHGISPEYVSASIYLYTKKWIFSGTDRGETMSIYKRKSQRNVIQTLERLLPHGRQLLPCKLLFEMLLSAIELEATSACRNGFEIRIRKQLDRAKVKDLLIPSRGYSKKGQYDVECIRRILKVFYRNYESSDASELITVAKLIEELLAEIAGDIDLMMDTFISLAEITMAASLGTQRNSNGIYRAMDEDLDNHGCLTDKEKEQVCRVLDIQKMSEEACDHAAKNERLPVRTVVQLLLMAQLQLRDTLWTITKAAMMMKIPDYNEKLEEEEEEDEDGNGEMSIKVKELEKDCNLMKEEISNGCNKQRARKGHLSMWSEMKRKLGCMTITNIDDSHYPIKKKKVHPKLGL